MYIKKIHIQNFRCFEKLEICFPKRYAVLIGINGAGKSSVLDTISIALGSFFAGCDVTGLNFHKSDVHYVTFDTQDGDQERMPFLPHREPQYPIRIEAEINTSDKGDIFWARALNSERGRTTVGEARPIMDYAKEMAQKVRKNKPVVMPFFAYYGTGRLWLPKRSKQEATMFRVPSRLKGYVDALDAASNDKLMMEWFHRAAFKDDKSRRNGGAQLAIYNAVRVAIASFYASMDDDIESVVFEYDLSLYDIEIRGVRKGGRKFSLPLRYMSDGIKSMLSMVADISYRMATLNPGLGEDVIRKTEGVVLIDEIDMHLHPSWQKRILPNLCKTFPGIQFVVTTHAPAVLANVSFDHILFLDHGEVYKSPASTYGRDATAILRDVMGTEIRPEEVMNQKDAFYEALQDSALDKAEEILENLKEIIGCEDEEIVRMQVSLDLEKM